MGMFRTVYDVILDRTPAEILGAIGVAVALSFVISGLFALLRGKMEDRVLLVAVLLILTSVASMSLGAGFIASARSGFPRMRTEGFERFPGRGIRGPGLASRIIEAADLDGDGRISPAEAAAAASHFIAEQTGPGVDSVDHDHLARSIGERWAPPGSAEADTTGGPGRAMADHLIALADRDQDGRLTVEEAANFLRSADEDGDGAIGRRELVETLRRGIPAPPVVGPPLTAPRTRPGDGVHASLR